MAGHVIMNTVGPRMWTRHQDLSHEVSIRTMALEEDWARADPAGLIRYLREEVVPHARLEEDVLYPVLERLLAPGDRTIEMLRLDHALLNQWMDALANAAAELAVAGVENRSSVRRRIIRLALQIEALFQVHVEKEERFVHPLLDERLGETERRELEARLEPDAARGEPPLPLTRW